MLKCHADAWPLRASHLSKALTIFIGVHVNRSHKSLMQTIAMYTWITVGFCFRFLFGNLYGVLVTMFIVRAFSESLFGFPPYSTYEVITWLYSLSDEMKVAIAVGYSRWFFLSRMRLRRRIGSLSFLQV